MMNIFNIGKSMVRNNRGSGEANGSGLVFIPDISGFTELVRSTDLMTGKSITFELLSSIIAQNKTNLEIAEIEGDAVFFFKWQPFLDIDAIKEQFNLMKAGFDQTKKKLEERYNMRLELQLKAVAHYGIMTQFSLGGFTKMYGEVVIEAHRLLKNSVPEHSYLLVTDELAVACSGNISSKRLNNEGESTSLCEIYQGLRNICYTYTIFKKSMLVA